MADRGVFLAGLPCSTVEEDDLSNGRAPDVHGGGFDMTDLISTSRQTSAGKVLTVLKFFGSRGGAVTLGEVAHHTNMPRSTAHRMLASLRTAGLVELQDGLFVLSGGLVELAAVVPANLAGGLPELVLPSLTDLYESTKEAAQFVVRRGDSGLVVEGVHGRQSVGLLPRLTGTMPLHCTAAGKVLLAFSAPLRQNPPRLEGHTAVTITSPERLREELARVQRYGVAFDRGEWIHGLTGVAAPVWGPGRTLVGAISVVGPFGRVVPDAIAPRVRRVADIASRELYTERLAGRGLAG
ncbi:IclR family transcriptional regulator [Lentzea sp. DG1S-22]|uniref:IclR family transcriptional regulator n=1 Tax=Lentzea sp. DG1S-22 TaxID=3108822 RepID=UPI002E780A9B|nr:IclR family transcriptional regulator [Lentzea sp. DG1S-22]WVH82417.1 IclR family transcriptional regulator [Lentzea sp. DG1S-22]